MELVSDLSTAAFLACLRRFIARRGRPSHILTDNGTNFVGARRELEEVHNLLEAKTSSDELQHFFTNQRVNWSHIPGRAQHFGGLWEAAVKSMKILLSKSVGSHRLTFEEISTILTEAEAVMNSRPLTALDSTPTYGIQVLTPGLNRSTSTEHVREDRCGFQPFTPEEMEPLSAALG